MRASFSRRRRIPSSLFAQCCRSRPRASSYFWLVERMRVVRESTMAQKLNASPAQSDAFTPVFSNNFFRLVAIPGKDGFNPVFPSVVTASEARMERSSTTAQVACVPPRSIARAFTKPPLRLNPAARRRQDKYRHHQHRNSRQLNLQGLPAAALPLASQDSQHAGGNHDERHKQWPAQDRAPASELAAGNAI